MTVLVIPRVFPFTHPRPGTTYRLGRVFIGDPAYPWVRAWYRGGHLDDQGRSDRARDIPLPWEFPANSIVAITAAGRPLMTDATGWLYPLGVWTRPNHFDPSTRFRWPI